MSKWVVEGERIGGRPYVVSSREAAERFAELQLVDIWDQPCVSQCGRTDGVERHVSENTTTYVWGDGYVARVVKAKRVKT